MAKYSTKDTMEKLYRSLKKDIEKTITEAALNNSINSLTTDSADITISSSYEEGLHDFLQRKDKIGVLMCDYCIQEAIAHGEKLIKHELIMSFDDSMESNTPCECCDEYDKLYKVDFA